MTRFAYYDCPFGILEIGCEDDAIVSLRCKETFEHPHDPTPLSERAAGQLAEYFKGRRTDFDFPLTPAGTVFQKAVWQALREIPYGEVRSYGQIAASAGRPQAARAVGGACNRNPIWILIPCHRVVGTRGSLTGYAGGLSMKQTLLNLEQR